MNTQQIQAQLRLFALQAVAQTEALSVNIALAELPKFLSAEKEQHAVESVCASYRSFEARIPALEATTIDDDLVRAGAQAAVHWAFALLAEQLNGLAPVAALPVTNAPELPSGADQ